MTVTCWFLHFSAVAAERSFGLHPPQEQPTGATVSGSHPGSASHSLGHLDCLLRSLDHCLLLLTMSPPLEQQRASLAQQEAEADMLLRLGIFLPVPDTGIAGSVCMLPNRPSHHLGHFVPFFSQGKFLL